MHFESPIPADMASVLEKWRNYTHVKPLEDEEEEPLDKEAANNMK
jgi:hypothetical protein